MYSKTEKAKLLFMATAATGLAMTTHAAAQLGAPSAGNQPPPASQTQTTPSTAVAPNTTPAQPGQSRKVEEIIVTSQKRRQNVQDVPLSVTALSNASLDQNNISDFSRIDELIPGLQFGQSGNDARPAIRGTRTQNVVGNADPLVSFYVDDVYRSRPGEANSPFVDLDRVEVERGPQGTLNGRNSFGGTVNVLSKAPVLGLFDYGGEAGYTSYNGRRFEGYVNVPITPDLALRVTGYDSQRDGYVYNTDGEKLHDEDTQYVRVQLRYQPSDLFSNVARFEYWHSGGNGGGDYGYYTPGVPIDPATGLTNGVHGIIDPRVGIVPGRDGGIGGIGPTVLGDPDPYHVSLNFPQKRDINQFAFSDTATLALGDFADAKAILSGVYYDEFRLADADFTSVPLYWNSEQTKDHTFSEELQIASRPHSLPIPLNWVAGVYFLQDFPKDLYLFGDDPASPALAAKHLTAYSTSPAVDPGIYIGGPFDERTYAYAAYADANYAILPWLKVLGGVRWTQDEKSAKYFNPAGDNSPNQAPGFNKATYAKFTWRAGLEVNVARRSMLYFTASTGFLSGGFDGTGTLDTYKPQSVNAYELGSKNVFLDGRLRANLSLYYNEYSELLSQMLIFLPSGAIVTKMANAGAVTAYGAEGEVDFYPIDPLYLGVRLSLNHSRFDNFITSNSYTEGGNDAGGTAFQLDGRQVPLNPNYTLSFITSYNFDFGRFGVFTPAATVYASDSYRTSDQPYFFANQGSYVNLDLHLRWKPKPESPVTVEVYADNVTDNTVLLRTTPNTGGVVYQDFAPPLIVGGRVSYHY